MALGVLNTRHLKNQIVAKRFKDAKSEKAKMAKANRYIKGLNLGNISDKNTLSAGISIGLNLAKIYNA